MLADALSSVAAQGFGSVEHIIVDGGSEDGTLEMLQGHPEVIVLNERSGNLYAAINLGIERASGDVISLLNSDDQYAPGAFSAIAPIFAQGSQADVACGFAELFDETGVTARFDDKRDLMLDPHAALIGACITNARFFRASVFRRVGLFSTGYSIVADRDYLVRILIAGLRTIPVDHLVYRYRRHMGSLTFAKGAEREEPIRLELLKLARAVIAKPDACAELRRKARVLEGLCLATLVTNRLRAGKLGGALARLLTQDGRITAGPLRAVGALCLDRFVLDRSRWR